MKKLLSLTLALLMVFSLATVALADETPTDTTEVTITKTLTATGLEDTTFSFTVSSDGVEDEAAGVTQPAIEPDGFDITVTTGQTSGTYTINLPTYSGVGIYTYKITESSSSIAGVNVGDNDAPADLYLVVTVTNGATTGDYIRTVAVHSGSATGSKDDTDVENTYSAGELKVTKEVTGNLGDKTKEFTVAVTFEAPTDETINSVISYTDGADNKTIGVDAWTEGEAAAEITLIDGETVTFTNIPYGVTYTVKENDYTGDDGYDPAKYNGTESAAGYEGTINSDSSTVTITNNKSVEVDTGITLDSVPFILILSVCAAAVVLFVIKRRNTVEF